MQQDKKIEQEFFRRYALDEGYDVFFPKSNEKLVDYFEATCKPGKGALVADLGCGAGVFTDILRSRGYQAFGLDLCCELLQTGQDRFPKTLFLAGDVEELPFPDSSLDAVMLSGIVHHLPDPSQCAKETARVLKPGGKFFAFDPNRWNPFMYLYRDKNSPLYSSKGVTENERPVIASQVANAFHKVGLLVRTDYLSGLKYQNVESPLTRLALPLYNMCDEFIFAPKVMKKFRAFVLTSGHKAFE